MNEKKISLHGLAAWAEKKNRPAGYMADVLSHAKLVTDTHATWDAEVFDQLRRKYDAMNNEPAASNDRWPWAARILAKLAHPQDRGLGDVMQRIFAKGGGEIYKSMAARLGMDCGCAQRQEAMNSKYPFTPKPPTIRFEQCLVINLDRRPDRWEAIQKRIAQIDWPFPQPVRFAGIDGKDFPAPSWFKGGNGAWGALQSHMAIWAKMIREDVQSVLVLEDDAVFVSDFGRQVRAFVAAVPEDWDQIYFGGQHLGVSGHPPTAINNQVVRPHNVNRAHCYAVRRPFMRVLHDYLGDYDAWGKVFDAGKRPHLDHRMGDLHESRKYHIYAPMRWLVGQAAGQSNINGKKNPEHFWHWTPSKKK